MAQKKKPATKRARNKDGTYKGDDKSTPDVNEAYERPKKATKATAVPRNPASKERAKQAAGAPKKPGAKKPAAKKKPAYAPKVRPLEPTSPVADMLTKDVKPAKVQEVPPIPPLKPKTKVEDLWRSTPPEKKKSRLGKIWTWMVGV